MPDVSSDSDSEPDLSVLAMARGGNGNGGAPDLASPQGPFADHRELIEQQRELLRSIQAQAGGGAGGTLEQEEYEAEDTSVEEQVEEEVETEEEGGEDEEEEEEDDDDEEEHDDGVPLADPAAAGLKEISNLGKFTVSSHKQGNGVEELRNDDTKAYWQ